MVSGALTEQQGSLLDWYGVASGRPPVMGQSRPWTFTPICGILGLTRTVQSFNGEDINYEGCRLCTQRKRMHGLRRGRQACQPILPTASMHTHWGGSALVFFISLVTVNMHSSPGSTQILHMMALLGCLPGAGGLRI